MTNAVEERIGAEVAHTSPSLLLTPVSSSWVCGRSVLSTAIRIAAGSVIHPQSRTKVCGHRPLLLTNRAHNSRAFQTCEQRSIHQVQDFCSHLLPIGRQGDSLGPTSSEWTLELLLDQRAERAQLKQREEI